MKYQYKLLCIVYLKAYATSRDLRPENQTEITCRESNGSHVQGTKLKKNTHENVLIHLKTKDNARIMLALSYVLGVWDGNNMLPRKRSIAVRGFVLLNLCSFI